MDIAEAHLVLSITTTVGSLGDAHRLAQLLLDRRLAACVQVEPGLTSHYRWKGVVCEDAEVRLTVKTLPERVAQLQALFDEHHPYELPQFLLTEMAASPGYAQWVRDETAAAS